MARTLVLIASLGIICLMVGFGVLGALAPTPPNG